jgi:hypothetical protein
MQLFGYGCIPVGLGLSLLALIHPSAKTGRSPKLQVAMRDLASSEGYERNLRGHHRSVEVESFGKEA